MLTYALKKQRFNMLINKNDLINIENAEWSWAIDKKRKSITSEEKLRLCTYLCHKYIALKGVFERLEMIQN